MCSSDAALVAEEEDALIFTTFGHTFSTDIVYFVASPTRVSWKELLHLYEGEES